MDVQKTIEFILESQSRLFEGFDELKARDRAVALEFERRDKEFDRRSAEFDRRSAEFDRRSAEFERSKKEFDRSGEEFDRRLREEEAARKAIDAILQKAIQQILTVQLEGAERIYAMMADHQRQLDAAKAQSLATKAEIDERLNALIRIVDDMIRDRRQGGHGPVN